MRTKTIKPYEFRASVMSFDKTLEEKELYEHYYKAEASKLAIRFQYSLGRAKYYKKEVTFFLFYIE